MTVNNSTISSNSASYGGGIFSRAESYYADTLVAVTVNNSTISGNTAIQKGGGIFNFAYDYSGHPTQALVTLNNSTITGNSAANGGGVYTGRLSGTASTYLHRSLVSGNSAGTGDELASAGAATSTWPTTTCSATAAIPTPRPFTMLRPALPTSPPPAMAPIPPTCRTFSLPHWPTTVARR